MSARKKDNQINLLPQKGLASTTTGRILAWLLSTFRIIVIVTEIIVMIAFLSRFWLDAQNTDLTDDIKRKQAVIASYEPVEREFRDTQKRLKIYADVLAREVNASEIISNVTKQRPEDVYFESVIYDDKGISIEGRSPSEQSIQQFLINLRSEDFPEATITEVRANQKDSSYINFKIQVTQNQKESTNNK